MNDWIFCLQSLGGRYRTLLSMHYIWYLVLLLLLYESSWFFVISIIITITIIIIIITNLSLSR